MFPRLLLVGALAVLVWALVPHASSGAGRERAYVVLRGDTLWSIAAARYGGDPRAGVWKLQRRNELGNGVLVPGQRLVLPP